MKKKITILLAVACLVFCNAGLLASAERKPSYCAYCGAVLAANGQHMATWTTTHEVDTKLRVDGKPIMAICTVYHNVDRELLYCPNGCGEAWHEDKETESHSSEYCAYHKK